MADGNTNTRAVGDSQNHLLVTNWQIESTRHPLEGSTCVVGITHAGMDSPVGCAVSQVTRITTQLDVGEIDPDLLLNQYGWRDYD